MTSERFEELVSLRMGACDNELLVKGADYADRDGDRLSNFKGIAEVIRVTTQSDEIPINAGLVWFVYFYKHIVPIVKALVLEENLQSESLGGRFTDAINYLLLGEGLADDRRREFADLLGEVAADTQYTDSIAVNDEGSEIDKKIMSVAKERADALKADVETMVKETFDTPWYRKPLEKLTKS